MQMNEWSSLSSKQEEIIALNAKMAYLDKELEQVNKSKTKTKEENKNKNKNNDKDREWMKEKPKGNEKKVRGLNERYRLRAYVSTAIYHRSWKGTEQFVLHFHEQFRQLDELTPFNEK